LGWRRWEIAAEVGVTTAALRKIASGGCERVKRGTLEGLRALDVRPVKVPVGPLVDAVVLAARRRGLTVAGLLGERDRRALYRGVESGWVSDAVADRVAVAAGVGPLELLYGSDYDEVTA
jgi:hypothetical protein